MSVLIILRVNNFVYLIIEIKYKKKQQNFWPTLVHQFVLQIMDFEPWSVRVLHVYVIHMKNECQIIKKCVFLRDKIYFAYDYIKNVVLHSWIVNIKYDLEPMGMDSLDVLRNNNMYLKELYNKSNKRSSFNDINKVKATHF